MNTHDLSTYISTDAGKSHILIYHSKVPDSCYQSRGILYMMIDSHRILAPKLRRVYKSTGPTQLYIHMLKMDNAEPRIKRKVRRHGICAVSNYQCLQEYHFHITDRTGVLAASLRRPFSLLVGGGNAVVDSYQIITTRLHRI